MARTERTRYLTDRLVTHGLEMVVDVDLRQRTKEAK